MDLKLDPQKAISILIYVVLIGFLIFALWMEKRDVFCSNPTEGDGKCGVGMGTSYSAGRPESDDSFQTLLKKIRLTSRYELNSIIWRRAFIIAAISAFLVLYIYKKRMPSGLQLGASFLVIYIVCYLVINAFQKLISEPANKQMDALITQLGLRSASFSN